MKYSVALRKVAKRLSYRKRYLSLSSIDQVRLKLLKKLILVVIYKIERLSDEIAIEKLNGKLRKVVLLYSSIVYTKDECLESCERYDRTIRSFTASDCKLMFEFKKRDLLRLFPLLHFPDECKFDNRSIMAGEEVLRGLYELVSASNKHDIARFFGRDWSAQSRAFTYFIEHLYDNFKHLVLDNLPWWYRNGFFASSAEAIGKKMNLGDDHKNMIAHFIDCNCLETCRVGGGPAEDGCNSARWDPNIQRAHYNGWKSLNGLKHQTVDNAFGFTVDLFGPTSLRRNDLTLLRLSNINERMAELQRGEEDQYMTFGDSAYKRRSHLTSYYADIDDLYRRWNRRMKRVRISIEWNYGTTASLFKYICCKRKLKVLQSTNVSKIYIVCTLLRNIYIALYGCQTSNYFDLDIPDNFLEKYLMQENFN